MSSMRIETAEQMQSLGESIAAVARGGDVLILTGELGAGKTTFAQGVARGLGITEPVTSPTFVMSKSYPPVGSLGLLHLDVYRVSAVDQLLDLWSEIDAENALTLVEWGGPWVGEFGETVVEMRIDSESEFGREIAFTSYPPSGDAFLRRVESVLT
jgi:tRNA threonylcarbamoyladenosine biosynthesis protein TsaE